MIYCLHVWKHRKYANINIIIYIYIIIFSLFYFIVNIQY